MPAANRRKMKNKQKILTYIRPQWYTTTANGRMTFVYALNLMVFAAIINQKSRRQKPAGSYSHKTYTGEYEIKKP